MSTGYQQAQPFFVPTGTSIDDTAWLAGAGDNVPRDNLFPYLDMMLVDSNQSDILTMAPAGLGGVGAIGNSETATTNQTNTVLLSPSPRIELTSYIGDVVLTQYAERLMSGVIDQLLLQLAFKRIAIIKQFLNDLYRPQVGASIKGLPNLITQIVPGAAAVFNPQKLRQAITMVQGRNGEKTEKLIIMHPNTLDKINDFMMNLGIVLDAVMINGNRYLMWEGVPILVSYYVPLNEGVGANETSIWVVANRYHNGGLYLACPSRVGDNGWVTEKVQLGTNTDTYIYRTKWFVQTYLQTVTGGARYPLLA